ncbi:MAG: nucleotidyltransferase family protein, partial [Clostridia bacterium]|nr:nucleotidyltransferase family protein [Clostridia bacterium]
LAAAWNPDEMDVLLLVAATPASSGVDWPGDFTMDGFGRLTKREERRVAPFVYTGIGIIKPELFADAPEGPFRLLPYFLKAAETGRLHGLRLDGIWLHVGTPQAIDDAERLIARSVL